MTYNFDPDRWYANEHAMLEHQLQHGHISREQFEQQVEALTQKYDDMVKRLDGTYQLPK